MSEIFYPNCGEETEQLIKRKELLQKLLKMKVGTVLKKGNKRRILLGIGPGCIIYSTPSQPKVKHMQNVISFIKWAEKAVVEEVQNETK